MTTAARETIGIDVRGYPAGDGGPQCAGMRALVTGATGFIGVHLAQALLREGAAVRALVRDARKARRLPREVRRCFGGLSERALPEGIADGIDVVFHLGAATAGGWGEHERTTVEGTRRLLEACHAAGVQRFIHVSSLRAHETEHLGDGRSVTEQTPLAGPDTPLGPYARGKAESERIVHSFGGHNGLKFTIVRPGLVYGPGHTVFEHLGKPLRGSFVAFGPQGQLLPMVSVQSVVEALLRIAASSEAEGRTYLVVDQDLPREQYIAMLGEATGQKYGHATLPPVLAEGLAGMLQAARRITGLKQIPDTSIAKTRSRMLSVRHDCGALQRDTDWRPRPVTAESLREAVQSPPEPPAGRFRVGVIGAGAMAGLHLAALRRIQTAEVVGIVDICPGRAAELAREGSAEARCASYEDVEAFFAESAPDVVHIVTPPRQHCQAAIAALERGVHVLCEKPLAFTVDECRRMMDAARAGGVVLGVNHNYVFDERVVRIRRMIEAGRIGELRHIDLFWAFDVSRVRRLHGRNGAGGGGEGGVHWSQQLPGGLLEDLAPHPLSIAAAVLGPQLRVAHASLSGRGRSGIGDMDEELRVMLESPAATATVTISLTARPDDFTASFFGARATIRADLQDMLVHEIRMGGGPKAVARGLKAGRAAALSLVQLALNPVRLARGRTRPPADPLPLMREFYHGLSRGTAPPAPADQGTKVVELIRSIWPA